MLNYYGLFDLPPFCRGSRSSLLFAYSLRSTSYYEFVYMLSSPRSLVRSESLDYFTAICLSKTRSQSLILLVCGVEASIGELFSSAHLLSSIRAELK